MSLPAIDIPLKLPFEVPLMVHPIFVHFAIAIPVIVILLEIANIKARNRAVSVTSLFLMTLALLVYAGAFFTGKADGSHAFAMLSADAKEELKFHKLLGTYLVYAMGILYIMKILAMLVKRPWARDMFIAFLLIFIIVLFKQGKDGGELVYEYGVNVKPVTELQDRIDEMEYDIDDLKTELKKAKEAAPAASETSPAMHEETPATHEETAPATTEPEATPEHGNHEAPAVPEATNEESSDHSVETTEAHETAEAAHEEAAESMHEAVQNASDSVEHGVEEATGASEEITGHTGDQSAEEAHEETHEDTTPVQIPTH